MITPRSVRALGALLVVAALGVAACGGDGESSIELSPAGEAGRQVALQRGCASCHGNDGEGRVGPPLQGLFGSTVTLDDGSTLVADEAYVVESILEPDAKRVEGYRLPMPQTNLSDDELARIVTYIRELGGVVAEEAAG